MPCPSKSGGRIDRISHVPPDPTKPCMLPWLLLNFSSACGSSLATSGWYLRAKRRYAFLSQPPRRPYQPQDLVVVPLRRLSRPLAAIPHCTRRHMGTAPMCRTPPSPYAYGSLLVMIIDRKIGIHGLSARLTVTGFVRLRRLGRLVYSRGYLIQRCA